MRLLIMDGDTVVNVIDVDPDNIPAEYSDAPIAPDHVGVGMVFDGTGYALPEIEVTAKDVNAERDRRITLQKTVIVGDRTFPVDIAAGGRENLGDLGAAALAKLLLGDTSTFSFRDAANTDHDLTPTETAQMGLQLTAQISAIHVAARAIKAMDPIPQDYRDDTRWP